MAQQDAMEQVKEVVRQIIKYRFWISVGVAALFGLIAYAVGSGPVRDQFKKESDTIKGAEKTVKQYTAPGIPTKDYEPIVVGENRRARARMSTRLGELSTIARPRCSLGPKRCRNGSANGAGLGPRTKTPAESFWARSTISAAYKDYVDMVYKTFKPFDYQTGEGIVVAAPKEVLLRPAVFSDEKVPGLGKIWAAQERLWIQHTLLEVVAEVNKNAKDWDSAIVREIETMEVGSPIAQDQRSLAKNEELEEAKNILAPGETEETAETAAVPGGMGGAGMPVAGMMGRQSRNDEAGWMMGGGGRRQQTHRTISYVKVGERATVQEAPGHDERACRPGSCSGLLGRTGKLSHVHPSHGFRVATADRPRHQTRERCRQMKWPE